MKPLVLSVMIVFSGTVYSSDQTVGQLETKYWDCDYQTSISMLDFGSASECSEVFEELKTRKFFGNFGKFMEWWKANKDSEHRKRQPA
jgi:outer membrane protein assembly factor BamD (BamD/ComL family)